MHNDEDQVIDDLTDSAREYIKDAMGKDADGVDIFDENDVRVQLLIKILTLHYYENRGIVKEKGVSEIPNSFTSILLQLKDGL